MGIRFLVITVSLGVTVGSRKPLGQLGRRMKHCHAIDTCIGATVCGATGATTLTCTLLWLGFFGRNDKGSCAPSDSGTFCQIEFHSDICSSEHMPSVMLEGNVVDKCTCICVVIYLRTSKYLIIFSSQRGWERTPGMKNREV